MGQKNNFSKDKKRLLKTHLKFDGYESGSNAQDTTYNQLVQHQSLVTGNSLITYAAIEVLCSLLANHDKELMLAYFHEICAKLQDCNLLKLDHVFEVLLPKKRQFVELFSQFVNQIRDHNLSSQSIAHNHWLSRNSISGPSFDRIIYFPTQYEQNFVELEVIDKGGFGIVCKAKHKVDNNVYAVKKIPFKYTNDAHFKMITREAQSFALLKHENIVRYNYAWIDNNVGRGKEDFTSSSSSDALDSETFSGSEDDNVQSSHFQGLRKVNSYGLLPSSNMLNYSELSVSEDPEVPSFVSVTSTFNQNSVELSKNISLKQTFEGKESGNFSKTDYSGKFVLKFLNNSDTSLSVDSKKSLGSAIIKSSYDENNSTSLPMDSQKSLGSVVFQSSYDEDKSTDGSSFIFTRHRHSSGATCSSADNQSEAACCLVKDLLNSNAKSYNHYHSLSYSRAQEIVPLASNVLWDISPLNLKAILYIQMELCDKNLRQWLSQRADDSTEEDPSDTKNIVMNIFRQVLKGVEYIHSESIIHRDLKPSNIFLCNSGVVKIGDFGLATVCGQAGDTSRCSSSCHSGVHGTAPYAAPEQKKCNNYDAKVDIYSLGIIFVELLQPVKTMMEFYRTIEEILKGNFPEKFLKCWPELVQLIKISISINPKERPNAKEILISDALKVIQVQKDEVCMPSEDLSENENVSLREALMKANEEIASLKASQQPSEDLSENENVSLHEALMKANEEIARLKASQQEMIAELSKVRAERNDMWCKLQIGNLQN